MGFYNPFVTNMGLTPVIVYPDQNLEDVVDRGDSGALIAHLTELYLKNANIKSSALGTVNYQIDFVWSDQGAVMTDIWTFARLGEWDSGPLADNPRIFRGFERDMGIGIGSGSTLIVLGREEELRRSYGDEILKYLTGKRAELPEGLLLGEDF